MYNYSELQHYLTIQSVSTSAACPELLKAPAITLHGGSFITHAKYDIAHGYSSPQTVQTLSQIASTKVICGNVSPSVFLLINCAFDDEISSLQRPFSEYRGVWKLYYLTIRRNRCTLRFTYVPNLTKEKRSIAELTISYASIALQCRVQYSADKKHRCETYKCNFMPHDTPAGHAPIEIGIRSISNYPTKHPRKENFNCTYTIRDYLE